MIRSFLAAQAIFLILKLIFPNAPWYLVFFPMTLLGLCLGAMAVVMLVMLA